MESNPGVVTKPKRRDWQPKIMELLKSRGTFGMTCDEIEVELGARHQSISPALLQMRRAKVVEYKREGGKYVRRNTRAGHPAHVYVVTAPAPPGSLWG